jgi:hypothetical protein
VTAPTRKDLLTRGVTQNEIVSDNRFCLKYPSVLHRNTIRCADVIIIEEGNELTTGLRNEAVTSLSNTAIVRLAYQPNRPNGLAPITNVCPHYVGRTIAGGVVYDQNLKPRPVLSHG